VIFNLGRFGQESSYNEYAEMIQLIGFEAISSTFAAILPTILKT
jgi:hypothetical protein